MTELVLRGIDGGNPLGFLAALGTAVTARSAYPALRLGWRQAHGAWRPVLGGCGEVQDAFIERLHEALRSTSPAPFEIDQRLPFPAEKFACALRDARHQAMPENRRYADMLCAFGNEIVVDEKDKERRFQDSAFRMVRSGDAAGQGLPYYAIAIRAATGTGELRRALFEPWDYRDEGFSLRWDPLEDQRYALRWHDPKKKKKDKQAPRTMLAANALALEALPLFPAVPGPRGLATTAFHQERGRREYFTWPVWIPPVSIDIVRSLVSMPELQREDVCRAALVARGIVEIYRCERIAPNQYYRNFSPAAPA